MEREGKWLEEEATGRRERREKAGMRGRWFGFSSRSVYRIDVVPSSR